MNKDQLFQAGGVIATGSVVKKDCTWTNQDGETFDFVVGVLKLSFGVVEKMLEAAHEVGPSSAMISAAIRLGEEFDQELTPKEVSMLDPNLAKVFAEAVAEVNPAEKKPSTQERKSGTS